MECLKLSCHSRHHFTHYNALITNRLRKMLKVTANEKQKKYGNRVNIKTASWLDVLDELHIWMYCIFGCIVFLDELVIIGLGIKGKDLRERDCG